MRTLFFDAEASRAEKVRRLLAAHWNERPPAPSEALHPASPARWTEIFARARDVPRAVRVVEAIRSLAKALR